jgi:hypothetical protein
MVGFDLVQILWYVLVFLIGCVFSAPVMAALFMIFDPNLLTWVSSTLFNRTPIIEVSGDGPARLLTVGKHKPSQTTFNADTPSELADPAQFAERDNSMFFGGKRVLFRFKGSALPMSPKAMDGPDLILKHVDENKDKYPNISQMADFEIMELVSADPVTLSEIITRNCVCSPDVVVEGVEKKLTQEEKDKKVSNLKKDFRLEVEALKHNITYVPRRDHYLNIQRVVTAVQQTVTPVFLNNFRHEVEAGKAVETKGLDFGCIAIGGIIGIVGGVAMTIAAMKIMGL